ncbi:MAG TPA: shikimate kinase [Beijerinckiaceae bacterium]|mgnify:CR=1 FL=1|nr:shikimate kinase [Beijerinckiaceae bacterium]
MSKNEPDAVPVTAAAQGRTIVERLGDRSIVLVGMMGAGKTSIGKRLGQFLDLPFIDADDAIEEAADMSIPDIFARHGEAEFRAGERRVIARLLKQGPQVLATGGGAFMNEATRQAIREAGLSLWLKADFDVIMRRVRRRSNRPLLKTDDPEATVRKLIAERYPVYALADITVLSADVPHEEMVDVVVAALANHLAAQPEQS